MSELSEFGADGRALYVAAIERYARDPEFHARAVRIEHLIAASEREIVDHARTGARIGAAVALYLADEGRA